MPRGRTRRRRTERGRRRPRRRPPTARDARAEKAWGILKSSDGEAFSLPGFLDRVRKPRRRCSPAANGRAASARVARNCRPGGREATVPGESRKIPASRATPGIVGPRPHQARSHSAAHIARGVPHGCHHSRQARAGRPRAEVGCRVARARNLRLRPHPRGRGRPAGRVLGRHPAPDGIRKPPHRARVLVHAHRREGALRAHARQDRVLPDGLGRQRPSHRAPRAELLRRALRPFASVRRRLHSAVRGRRQQEQQGRRPGAHQPPQLHRAVRAAHGRGREAVRGPLPRAGPERRLDADLPHDLRRFDPHEPAGVPAQHRARRGVPGPRADAVGRGLPLRDRPGRARGPRPARGLPPRRLRQDRRLGRRVHRDHPSRAAPGVRGARGEPRRRALPAAVRHDRAHAPLRRRGARARAPRSRRRTRARASP